VLRRAALPPQRCGAAAARTLRPCDLEIIAGSTSSVRVFV
jgi:hypothetical protein